jgi:hypothetical protein
MRHLGAETVEFARRPVRPGEAAQILYFAFQFFYFFVPMISLHDLGG